MNLIPNFGRVLVRLEEDVSNDKPVAFGSHGTAVLQAHQPLQFQARVIRTGGGARLLDISEDGIRKWEPVFKDGDLVLVHVEAFMNSQITRFREHWNQPMRKGEELLVPSAAILGVIEQNGGN
jgi:hypothetical protein